MARFYPFIVLFLATAVIAQKSPHDDDPDDSKRPGTEKCTRGVSTAPFTMLLGY